MKKTLILAALVLISAGCFAQKNPATKKAKNLMNSENPDFKAARASIKEALAEEPTAETYYWAGMIGSKEVDKQNANPYMGLAKDIEAVGEAMEESFGYLIKADELAQVPVLNKKGVEVPTDPKMRGKVQRILLSYYKSDDLIRYGAQLSDARDYAGAFKAFKVHLAIPELELMKDAKLQKEMPRDSFFVMYQSYAAQYAVAAEMHEDAIEMLEKAKDGDVDALLLNQYLCQEYMALKDTANYVEALHHGILRFPQEDFFIQNLVSYSVQANKEADAIAFFTQLIDSNPQETHYYIKRGVLYEMLEHFDEAMADFDKVLASNPQSAEALAGKGRVYYNRAVKMNEAAANIVDNKEYKKAIDEMNEVFRQSLPFFEQAHALSPDNTNYMQILKGLYYRFDMEDKYNEMNEKLNSL